MPKKKEMTIEEQYAAALPYLNELERRKGETDTAFFIERFVCIEDKDTPGIVTPFKLWSGQKQALNNFEENRLNIVLKARQLGFTWLALAYSLKKMIYSDGYSVVALSKGEEDAKELVRRVAFMLRHIPEWWIKHKGDPGESLLEWDSTAMQITIYRPGGEPSTFKSFPAAPDAGRSFTASLVVLDEWAFQQFAREIWTAAYPTINRPTGGKLIGLSTIKRGTLFEDIWMKSKDGDNTFKRTFLPWNTDPRRTPEWYEQTKKDIGEAVYAEYPASEEEAFKVPGGAFFNEVRDYIHIKPPEFIPKWAQRFVSLDYGLDMCAALWYWIDAQGYARVYRELHQTNLHVSEAAEKIKEMNGKEHITAYLAPPDLIHSRHRETGKTTADIFAEEGIYLTETSNDRETGWVCVKELLKPFEVEDEQTGEKHITAKLTIDEGAAPNLWHSLLNVQHNKNKYNDIENKGTAHDLSHIVDSLRCFAIYWITPSGEPTEQRRVKWEPDIWEDYYNCKTEEERQYMIEKYGNPF